ncbi:MAG: ComEC family competence protein [Bacteroides sp.]|nr:ComEC family competence protein [Bacteroides sp.]
MAWCCIAVCLGAANIEISDPLKDPKHYVHAGIEPYAVLELCEEPQERERSFRATAKLVCTGNDSMWREVRGLVRCYFTKDSALTLPRYGDRIVTRAELRPIEGFVGRDSVYFDYGRFMAKKGIYAQTFLSAQAFGIQTEHRLPPWKRFKRGTQDLRKRLGRFWEGCGMGKSELAVAKALILGERGGDPIEEAYRRSGIIHVLAVSGMHLSIFSCMLAAALSFLGRRKWQKWLRFLLVLLPVWGYAVLTGLSPSVNRAAYMFTVVGLGECLGREVKTTRSLAVSALILLLIKPALLYDAGFLLSYSAVAGLTLLNPLLNRRRLKNRVFRFFNNLVTASLSAQLATLPVILCLFGNFPTYFLIGNCLVAPLVNIALPMGIGISLVSLACIPLALWLARFMELLLRCMNFGVEAIGRLPAALTDLSISLPAAVLLYGVVSTGYLAAKQRSAPLIRRTLGLLLLFLWVG